MIKTCDRERRLDLNLLYRHRVFRELLHKGGLALHLLDPHKETFRRTNRAVLPEEPQMFHGMSEFNIGMLQGRADTAVRLVRSDSKTTQVQSSFAF